MKSTLLLLTLGSLAFGCVADGQGLDALNEGSETSGKADGVAVDDQENTDVQVLQAWRSDQRLSGDDLDLSACEVVQTYSYGTLLDQRDCTAQVEALVGPMAHRVLVSVYEEQDGSLHAHRFQCTVTENRTVTKQAVLDADGFEGIGFYHNETSELQLVPADRLEERDYGPVTLREGGTPARVHGFVALGACWRGTLSSSLYQREAFKPFVDFRAADGSTVFRRWEAHDNHALGQIWGYDEAGRTERFDRAPELLVD